MPIRKSVDEELEKAAATKPFSVRLPISLKATIAALAKNKAVTMNRMIVVLLTAAVTDYEQGGHR